MYLADNLNGQESKKSQEVNLPLSAGLLCNEMFTEATSEQLFADSIAETKRLHGQFFTTTNPFNVDPFHKWIKNIPCYGELVILEPFAGANNIVQMIQDIGYSNAWSCFDVCPINGDENTTAFEVKSRDTIESYPSGYEIAITNPPYLAKNSATRRGLPFPKTSYDDLYKVSLDVMLNNTPFVAAIIPESFITQGLFHSRLESVISLPCKMFEDTECPVCLALFVPEDQKIDPLDFQVYAENRLIGSFSALKKYVSSFSGDGISWVFNDPTGSIGLIAIDSQIGETIRFVPGSEILSSEVKVSSRSKTRIGGIESKEQALFLIAKANDILRARRKDTKDTFMTAFKGLRKDGKYRRRLDFAQARDILNFAATEMGLI